MSRLSAPFGWWRVIGNQRSIGNGGVNPWEQWLMSRFVSRRLMDPPRLLSFLMS